MKLYQESNTENNDNFENIVISTDFKTYNGHVKWPNDYEMSLGDALRYGNYNKAKDLITSGKDTEYYIDNLLDIHDEKMLELLWENGILNCHSEETEVFSSILYRYSNVLSCFREEPGHDFSDTGDFFKTEDDIHNKFLCIIRFLLEKEYNVNENIGSNKTETPLLIAIDRGLAKLVFYLVEDWNADVNFAPKNADGSLNLTPLEKLLIKIVDYNTNTGLEENDKIVLLNENCAIVRLLIKHNALLTEECVINTRKIDDQKLKNQLYKILDITDSYPAI